MTSESDRTDPTDRETTASPVGEVTELTATTPQGDTGGALPPAYALGPDTPDEYTIPRRLDDGADHHAGHPTYVTGEPARGATGDARRGAAAVDPTGT